MVATAPTNELTGPQTSVWHFGWNTPNSREYNANFRKMGLTIAQMWDGSDTDAHLVDLSGDVPSPPGGGFPTQEQVLELRAKGAKADRQAVFALLDQRRAVQPQPFHVALEIGGRDEQVDRMAGWQQGRTARRIGHGLQRIGQQGGKADPGERWLEPPAAHELAQLTPHLAAHFRGNTF